eukprot:6459309-Amphidinium_carterae.1
MNLVVHKSWHDGVQRLDTMPFAPLFEVSLGRPHAGIASSGLKAKGGRSQKDQSITICPHSVPSASCWTTIQTKSCLLQLCVVGCE